MKVSVVIPAYNEESAIAGALGRIREATASLPETELIVVDDGSTDRTAEIARAVPGVRVIRHPYNKGNGASVKAGIMAATGEAVLVIDADGQHDPAHIPEMIGALEDFDLVVGARKDLFRQRRGWGNYLLTKLASYLGGIRIPDLTSGYRVFKRRLILDFFNILPNGFSLPATSTLAFAVSGHNVKFIEMEFMPRKTGKSKISALKDGLRFLTLIARIISLFHPLKIFVPVSIVLFTGGLAWSVRTMTISGLLSPAGTMLILSGVFSFLFGLLADQVASVRIELGRVMRGLREK
jgi:glycosyltransferase involved in cell wall biosynthesis